MPAKDMQDVYAVTQIVGGASISATDWSFYIDRTGYEKVSCVVHSDMTTADADNYFTPALYYAAATPAANGSYTAVATADMVGTFSARNSTTTNVTEKVDYIGGAQYLAVKVTETSTAAGIVAVTWILSGKGGVSLPVSGTPTMADVT